MTYLLLSILASAGIYFSFKLSSKFKANTNIAITFNYIAATLLSLIFSNKASIKVSTVVESEWIFLAIITGILFIGMFFLISLSTQLAGMAITTSANKTSMVIPIGLSIYLEQSGNLTIFNFLALLLGVLAVILMSYKKDRKQVKHRLTLFLPLIIFLGAGAVDSTIKYAQEYYIQSSLTASFNFYVFLISAIIGLMVNLFRFKSDLKGIRLKDFLIGGLLGTANYFSLHFLIEALNFTKTSSTQLTSAGIFALNNIGVVLVSTVIGMLLFKERIEKQNIIGILISIFAIALITLSAR